MLKGGLLPSPVIVPLSSNPLALKNKIHTQTFIELRSDVPNVRIYFTVDGSKPDAFQNNRSSNLYRGAFRLGHGKRIVKAIAVTNNGSRESHITTKYFDVNDIYTEEYVDEDQSLPEPFSPDFDRTAWNEAFNPDASTQDWIEIPYEYTREPIVQPVRQQADLSHEEERFWERKCKPLSSGNGNWKRTMEHIFLNLYQFVKNEPQLRELFGWKIFGRIENACLIDKGGSYQILTTFKKPLGEQTTFEEPLIPIRKSNGKRRSKKRTRSPVQTVKREEESVDEEEQQKQQRKSPRIYTEEIEEHGTLEPFAKFDADRDCDSIRKAIKGSHTDEQVLIEILGNRTTDQRLKIRDKYKSLFNRDLEFDLKDDTSNSFRKLIKNLLYSSIEYDCNEFQRAINSLSIDETILIEILTTRSNKQLKSIANLYPKLFDRSLEKEISSETNGPIKRLLLTLVQNQRSDSNEINEDEVKKDAKSLYQSGEKKWGTDESKFIQLLSKRSDVQLRAIFEAYGKFSEHDIEEDIQSETSGTLRKGLLAAVRVMRNRPGFFAHRIKNALHGANTNEEDLNRLIITRCEVDMIQIKKEYGKMMKCSLEEHIENDTSDEYQEILLELIKDPNERTRTRQRRTPTPTRDKRETTEQPEIYREEIIQQGTMVPAANFDANRDVDALRKAMKGFGTNEKTLINILGNRTTEQRMRIKESYKAKLNRDLLSDLKSETSGDFQNLLERLMMNAIELDCFELKQAVKGAGTNEEALIEILASRSNQRIRKINETYKQMYSKSLEKDVSSDTSGDFRRLLIVLMQGQRPESSDANKNEVRADAQALVDAQTKRFKGDDATFNELFCQRSDTQLRLIFDEFANLAGKTIEETIKKETKGDHQKALLALVRCLKNRPEFFAEQLRNAMKGLGTKESTLNQILITRSEIDLVQIKLAYKNLFNRDLDRDIRSDTSGDYEKLLLELLKDPSQRS